MAAMSLMSFSLGLLFHYGNSQALPNPVPSPGCSSPNQGDSGTFTIPYDDYTRTFIVHKPRWSDEGVPMPLILQLHGYNENAQYMQYWWRGDSLADQKNYLSVYVQAATQQVSSGANINSWNDIGCSSSPGPSGSTCNYQHPNFEPYAYVPDGCAWDNGCNWCNCLVDDINFINNLSAVLENTYCLDMSREYVLGFSNGGMMSHRLGCSLGDRFAGFATFGGQQQVGFNCREFETNYPIGMFNVWGREDQVVCGEYPQGDAPEDACEDQDWRYYYTKVSAVQERFAQHNGCTTGFGPVAINTACT
eukprot:280950_1